MFYAGIDVAMDKHDCVILDANGKCFIEVFTFKNSRDGLPLFLWLKPLPLYDLFAKHLVVLISLCNYQGSFYPISISAFSCFFFLTFNS